MSAPIARHHAEWLQLIDISGPFVTLPVLVQAFPQGLDPDDRELAKQIRVAADEYHADPGLRLRWVRWVCSDVLGWPGDLLLENASIPSAARYHLPEHGVSLAADILLVNPGERTPRLHCCIWPEEQALDARVGGSSWTVSPRERAAELCRATGIPLALVTNGRDWVLVHARPGEAVGYATWDSDLWLDERLTLRAFRTLLGADRLFGVPDDEALEALLRRSDDAQREVTDLLGTQVRHAVELLVAELDRADQDAGGNLLGDVSNHSVYEAAVTVVMRLVFCFFAEEHDLLPLSESRYADRYAASTLRAQLQAEADQVGEDTLDARASAWHRLLALSRAVHGGVSHDEMRLPAYGGALFDPDRFPFLEGRPTGSQWRDERSRPLPISDRTVLHILSALQVLTPSSGRWQGEPQRLSYRALDVEQIGHVYEGLLDHDAVRIHSPALGFAGNHEEEVALELIERERQERDLRGFISWLATTTGLSDARISKALDKDHDSLAMARLRAACGNDDALAERARPYLGLLREDLRELPVIYRAGGIFVTHALDRRSSGSYYTPRGLAEEVVRFALEPLVHSPGPAEEADAARWVRKAPGELLKLKVCDMAMGSGAFLVGACRYLAGELVEAWNQLGDGRFTTLGESADDHPEQPVIPVDREERETLARRLVADRCLYGVDINPMAVDMAKLSLWLVTMAKDQPFSFLDHAIRSGDSLLGITSLRQLEFLHLDPARGNVLHGRLVLKPEDIGSAIQQAARRREELEAMPVHDAADGERKAVLLHEAEGATNSLRLLADALVGATLANARAGAVSVDAALSQVADEVEGTLAGDLATTSRLRDRTEIQLRSGAASPTLERRPFHWPLEFPEVFVDGGFHAVVGNPPFLGNKYWKRHLGPLFQPYWESLLGMGLGKPDLVALFLVRMTGLLRESGSAGSLATQSVTEVDSRALVTTCALPGVTIVRGIRSRPWPGTANVVVSQFWFYKGAWRGLRVLDGAQQPEIRADLRAGIEQRVPAPITSSPFAFEGVHNGKGQALVLSTEDKLADPGRLGEFIKPYVSGTDVTSADPRAPKRVVIDLTGRSRADLDVLPSALREYVFEHVAATRTPEKLKPYKGLAERWWTFWNTREDLFARLRKDETCVAVGAVAKYVVAVELPSAWVFTNKVVVFSGVDQGIQTLLLSAWFDVWLDAYGGSMGDGRVMKIAGVVNTLPLPEAALSKEPGARWQVELYSQIDAGNGVPTSILNAVNDPAAVSESAEQLRTAIRAVDREVARAYGWEDIPLDHGFVQTARGPRYSVSESSRQEIQQRLLALNHERSLTEGKPPTRGGAAKKRRVRTVPALDTQGRLGDL